MPIFLPPIEQVSASDILNALCPLRRNSDGSTPHVYCDGARFHVLSWSTAGRHCSEPDCEVNRERTATKVEQEK